MKKDAGETLVEEEETAINFTGDLTPALFNQLVLPVLSSDTTKWRSIWLFNNSLTDANCASLCQSRHFPQLRELYLGQNEITDAGVFSLCQALEYNTSCALEWLNLSENPITDLGVIALAKTIPKSRISVLWLEHCAHISNAGACALAQPACASQLSSLWVTNNQIGNEGMHALMLAWVFSPRNMYLAHEANALVSAELQREMRRLSVLLTTSRRYKILVALSCARRVKRLGFKSKARLLPNELLRMVADALPQM